MASLLAAAASPMVHPREMEWVCASAGTMKLVPKTEDGVQEVGAAHADCPMCMPLDAPPPGALPRLHPPLPQPLRHALRPIPAARIAALTAAPLPARGPPLSL
ncbi:hypothetical protein [Comamonas sp. GB3 AK4-5]|uniref:hypothetical protein n=1 Tax=Comamonas sp. GB3 AK4-5 TaxID=3231487 RepID=UPI00351E9708